MKGGRKLELVRGGVPSSRNEDAAPPITMAEDAAARTLRDALAKGDDPFAEALRSAYAPNALGEADLEAMVGRALGDESQATKREVSEGEQIRRELSGELPVHRAELLIALRHAYAPAPLRGERNEALIAAALGMAGRPPRLGGITPSMGFGLAVAVAMAAGIALWIGVAPPGSRTAATSEGAEGSRFDRERGGAAPVLARSADDLFDATIPFPQSGAESERVDRIAVARGAELRRNRFLAWGVR